MHEPPRLYVFSGLPGSGKSTLAQFLARELHCAYVRIDTIEQGLRDLCDVQVQGEGYRLAYRMAADNLRQGLSVVADSCNPIALTRREWEGVAREAQASHVNIEVVCTNPAEHRRRVETRSNSVPGLRLPDWQDVTQRQYEPWNADRIVIDTAHPLPECQRALLSELWEMEEMGAG